MTSFREKLIEDPVWPYWQQFAKQCAKAWNIWHNHWLQVAENSERPVYFFRFEDVLKNPREELRNLMMFILGIDDLDGTVIEKRIDEVLALGSAASQVYKPRSGGVNKNLSNYNRE